MKPRDVTLMGRIYDFFNWYYKKYEKKPTLRVIAKYVNSSPATVLRYMQEMDRLKICSYTDGEAATAITDKVVKSELSVPIVGSVSCGQPLLEEENIEAYVRLPKMLLGDGEFFLLHANGESMINAGINDGDLVVVKRCEEAFPGDIVVALTDENENTLKRFYPEPQKKRVRLKAENPDYDDIITSQCRIQGVAVKVLKNLSGH